MKPSVTQTADRKFQTPALFCMALRRSFFMACCNAQMLFFDKPNNVTSIPF